MSPKKKKTKKTTGASATRKRAAKKTVAKRHAAKKSTKKVAKKASKAASKKTTKKASASVTKKATTKKAATKKSPASATKQAAPKPKAAPTKASAAKPATARTTAKKKVAKKASGPVPIVELPTEELWSLYRVEALKHKGPKDKPAPPRMEAIRNTLIERHYPLVRYIAERLLQTLPKSIELDDLVSAGLFGLMDAIRGFDLDRGIKFKTYCSTRIRGSILDQLRSQDWVPRLVRLKASKIERAYQRLTGEFGREPTHAELARELEMEHGDLSKEIQEAHAKTMFSLSEKWEDGDEEGSSEKVEILEDKQAVDPVNELNKTDLMSYITRSLTHKERFIIEQYYQYGHTMREIGEMLALTESRVCQIHSNVMGRLKGLLTPKSGGLIV